MGRYEALVRALTDFKLALPDKNLKAFKEDVFFLPLEVASILEGKNGMVEIMEIRYFPNLEPIKPKEEVILHDMGKSKQEDMANVEG